MRQRSVRPSCIPHSCLRMPMAAFATSTQAARLGALPAKRESILSSWAIQSRGINLSPWRLLCNCNCNCKHRHTAPRPTPMYPPEGSGTQWGAAVRPGCGEAAHGWHGEAAPSMGCSVTDRRRNTPNQPPPLPRSFVVASRSCHMCLDLICNCSSVLFPPQ